MQSEAPRLDGDPYLYDSNSPLSKELQQHPWPIGYKPRIPAFDRKTNPRKFIASYEQLYLQPEGCLDHGQISF
jgi:hypothetical protein